MEGTINECEILDDCYGSASGCQYEMPADTIRDDVMTAGFVPEEYHSPFTITITKIEGGDYTTTSICPTEQTNSLDATWQRASTIQQSLFMTLTEMTALDVTALEEGLAASAHHVSIGVPHLLLAFIFFQFLGRRARKAQMLPRRCCLVS